MTEAGSFMQLEHDEDTLKGKYLIFSIGQEQYGIEIRYITEILGVQPITQVPEMPEYVKGITNLRGKIIPVMDARMRFGKKLKDYDDRTCIVVIDNNDVTTGLIVDRVEEVVTLNDEDVSPPLEITIGNNKFIKGFGKTGDKVKLLLDCRKLLIDEPLKMAI